MYVLFIIVLFLFVFLLLKHFKDLMQWKHPTVCVSHNSTFATHR